MNPELRRNLWLELNLHRLVALPVALGLVFMLVHSMSGPGSPIAATAATLFVIFALWGGTHAGDAMPGEVRARTWDGQRMSAIGPWAMTWGKLAGAPAFAWYGGLICLGTYLASSPERDAPRMVLFLFAGAIALHSVAFIAGMAAARKALVRSSSSAWMLALVVVVFGPWLSVLSSGEADISWWGRGWNRIDFLAASAAAFAAWGVFGAHRLMCQELRVRTLPGAWLGFLVFLSVYIAGLGIRSNDTFAQQRNVVLIAGLIVTLAATYPLLLSEASGPMAVRRLLVRVAERDWRRLLEETPLWPATLLLALAFCILTVLLAGSGPGQQALFTAAAIAPVPLFLLATRDAAIYMFFAMAKQPRRAEAATIFYLVLLYWLVPMLLRAVDAAGIADLVLPPFWDRPGYAAVVAAMQAVAVVAAALWRWRKNYGS